MSQQTYLKVPFVWEEPKPLIEVPRRLTFEPVMVSSWFSSYGSSWSYVKAFLQVPQFGMP
ncbi:hypothetical protein [Nostoc sp. 'Peltigera malacea cyanobiont' DB3992]|uniref:hypothetical protein n=1 Tax=Nostoc sp. 'Peltigera malacea cyanobiont' DB3992 TaxID=1206980 RepID=UPI00211E6DFB|nr:hypothetical protein [Nostoc sp. 'Peltigera malacea cyanobiont' DB3992]